MKIARTVYLAAALIALASTAHAKSPEEAAAACAAKGQFYKLSAPHKAGDINPRTNEAFKRNSAGVCRFDTAKAKAALSGRT